MWIWLGLFLAIAYVDNASDMLASYGTQSYVQAYGRQLEARTITVPERAGREWCRRSRCSGDGHTYSVRVRWCPERGSCHEDEIVLDDHFHNVMEVWRCSPKDDECRQEAASESVPIGTRVPIRVLGDNAVMPWLTFDGAGPDTRYDHIEASELRVGGSLSRAGHFGLGTFMYLVVSIHLVFFGLWVFGREH